MERLRTIPFYKRFSLRVFLFNAILLLCIIAPTRIIRKSDYKDLMNRITFHGALFDYCADRLSNTDFEAWPTAIDRFPGIFYQQRICVFTVHKDLVYDSGIMREFDRGFMLDNLLPDPYIDWTEENGHFDPSVYIDHLTAIDLPNIDPSRVFRSTRTVRYNKGLDRIILSGKLVESADGQEAIITMSDSLVDILITGRAVKERFLFLYSLVALLSLLLTIVLSLSVTGPLKRLYAYSVEIMTSTWRENDERDLPRQGEIGEICRALQGLIREQKEQSENFQRFSSDMVHELKTPLAAIRSGLELYAECDDEEERSALFHRINGRIQQMERLMNEVEHLGKLESRTDTHYSDRAADTAREVAAEFEEYHIGLDIRPDIPGTRVPLSAEKLYQVMVNLVKNAVSFSPGPGSVGLSVFRDAGFLHIRVRDTGPGIPPEVMPHITERFFSYRPKEASNHSGLGLSIVQAIVASCGGNLTCTDRPEGGAEFTCRIPIS